jgi:hypothetical protein
MAMHMSPQYMPAGARAAAIQMFNDPIFIGGTIVSIGLYIAAWLAPEPIFSKATAATITIALLTVFAVSEIKNLAVAWMRLSDESGASRTLDELEDVAKHFGESVGGIGMRVLITLATIIAGKALPGPKPMSGGGGLGELELATEGGPSLGAGDPVPAAKPPVAAGGDAGVAIKVLKDGTIVVLGPGAGATSQAVQSSGGSGSPSGPPSSTSTGGGPKTGDVTSTGEGSKTGTPDANKTTAGNPPKQTIAVKAGTPPEGFEDIFEQEGMNTRRSPGGKPAPEAAETGNFAHKYFEKLEGLLKANADELVSEKLPAKSEAEYPIKLKDVPNPPRIDRLDRAGETVIELKPKSLRAQGEAEAKGYAGDMDKSEPLPGGRKWKWKVVTYDFDKVLAFLKRIGYLPPKE